MVVQYTKSNEKIIEAKLLEVEAKDLKDGKKIVIPEGVTVIGENAFAAYRNTINVLQIKMPDTVKKIEQEAFSELNIKKIRFSKNLEEMGKRTFKCTKFKDDVILPDSLRVIPLSCFEGCEFKGKIILPKSLSYIEKSAFEYSKLDELSMPNSVINMEENVFMCAYIHKIKLSESLSIIAPGTFCFINKLKSINIPSSVKEIKNDAFWHSSLTTISLPDGLKEIGSNAFSSANIKRIELPETIQKIGEYCFSNNYSLKRINLPYSLKKIGRFAFANCSLGCVRLPSEVKLGPAAFYRNNIKSVMLSQEEYDCVKKKKNIIFGKNPLEEITVYNWKNNKGREKQISKSKVKRLGK